MDVGRLHIRPYGERAILVETADPVAVAAVARTLPGVEDAIPGEGCVVIRGVTSLDLAALASASAGANLTPKHHVLQVVYDGPDLADLPVDTAQRHAAGSYTVAFLGFSPGFAYLDGLDPALRVPRLATPRTRVPAGSVGIAGDRCCVYPAESPGGWRLIGRVVDAVLFDATHDPPALLAPGDTVTFTPARVESC